MDKAAIDVAKALPMLSELTIFKLRGECRNLPRKGRNTENYRPETGIRQRNPRECRGFSHTGKYHPGDPTAWLRDLDSNHD